MYGLFAGTKKVAVVEKWPLVEVQLYFFCRQVNSKTARVMYPLPAKCWHLVVLKKLGQIPKFVGSLDGQMPHRYRASKSVKSTTNRRLFKNFPMRQTVYSNVNNTARHKRNILSLGKLSYGDLFKPIKLFIPESPT